MPAKRLTERDRSTIAHYKANGLTPLQAAALDAFDGDFWTAQDEVTIASHLDGGTSLTPHPSMRVVAKSVLRQLMVIGLVQQGYDGWWWLSKEQHDAAAVANPMTADRLARLLGSEWVREAEDGNRSTWTLAIRHRRDDHVYCHATFHPKTVSVSYGVEHDCELISVSRSLMGQRWREWYEQLRLRHWRLRGPMTTFSGGQVYGRWSYCPPAMVEAMVVPMIHTLADVARLAARQIASEGVSP